MKKKTTRVKPRNPESIAFLTIQRMYDEITAKAVVALYRARDKAVREIARKYKIADL